METTVAIAAAVFAWGVVSSRMGRAHLTAPIVFVVLGAVLAATTGLVDIDELPTWLRPLVEVTLVWVLFSDAAGIRLSDARRDAGEYGRLLGIGLPLTVLAGWALAAGMFPELGVWLALLVGAALAPTDAALGLPVVTNPAVPATARRWLTVEGGLNDGIATPVVMIAIAGAATAEGLSDLGLSEAVVELVLGVVIGGVVGAAGGWLLRRARRASWADEQLAGIAVLALSLLAWAGSVTLHGNGFVAAFVGGLAFGATAGPRGANELVFLEQAQSLVSLLVWLVFGAIAGPVLADHLSWSVVAYAVLSLTVVRMVPVALASIGADLDRWTVLFIGWFGPRGLASLVFALIALEELDSAAQEAVAVITTTVLLSVVLHGVTAAVLAQKYGEVEAGRTPAA
ncbi:cation:proton antiporter [Nocardioides taihuensis]|uniref:Cation:proton antiporter n=1 Tax=Nocardioides taihuensis TaxID=1835606 RepID=A0ABW0BKU7_9ACTN